ncbi:MAG TPA: hypothetical protein VN723_14595 [Rhizomicrobium sp.]|jgi:hypothetical protein|nr:hypothetical protein [Rhizomicrobium sp.]
MTKGWIAAALLWSAAVMTGMGASGARADGARQSLDDAWWTGPLLANSAHTLPQGHALIESYVYDVISDKTNGVTSLSYLLYGATDRLTVGLVPTAGYTSVRDGADSAGPHWGDTEVRAQFRLTALDAEKGIPDLAIALIETVPTGKHDRLVRGSDGFGGGAYGTAVALYSQMVWWMPNGRILRTRLDLQGGVWQRAPISGVSVYGTGAGFEGHALPGNRYSIDAALEYSVTRNWVVAMDAIYSHGSQTIARGWDAAGPLTLNSGTSDGFGFAPALEYNVSSNLGFLAGLRALTGGHNSTPSLTPAIAINYVM